MNSETSFPRGLFQPEDSFKFSIDALLLAAFSDVNLATENILDLGSGCGVVGFSLLRRHAQVRVTGIDSQLDLVNASLKNAKSLSLEQRFSALCCDVELLFESTSIQQQTINTLLSPEHFDLVVTNPPYYVTGYGRQPKDSLRGHALFGEEQTLSNFCATAAKALKPKGRYCIIFPASRLSDLFSCCKEHGLGVRRLLCVHAKENKKAERILVEARKGVKDDITIEVPLFLYDEEGLSITARNFCPELI